MERREGTRSPLGLTCPPLSLPPLHSWWSDYAARKNDEEEEHVADSLLYDRNHLPRSAPAPDCVAAAGPRCGAGENVAYTKKAGANFTAVLSYLAQHRVGFLGQLKGASTQEADNPPDFWRALVSYRSA